MASLPEKFFKERDLRVLDESRVNVEQPTAQDWFDAVERTVGALPIYSHDNMGMPSDASTNRATTPEEDGVWFFRGQKDVSFAFHSTLYRRLLNAAKKGFSPKTPKDHEKAMVNAELALLSEAEENGIGRGLTALETLTLLQHHGSPTRLIDVTSDWKVALFSLAKVTTAKMAECFF